MIDTRKLFISNTIIKPQKPKRQNIKIQFCNQNLQEAIKEVKNSIKENPEWKTDHKNIELSNETSAPLKHPSLTLPPDSNPYLESLKYTERLKKINEDRVRQIHQKRSKLEAQLLEKQLKAKNQRKYKQNLKMKEQTKVLKEIQQRHQSNLRLRKIIEEKQKQEKSMIHEQRLAETKMWRKRRRQSTKQLSLLSIKNDDGKGNLTQRIIQKRKQMLSQRKLRYRCASQGILAGTRPETSD